MEAAVCPQCGDHVGFVPDGWHACITHHVDHHVDYHSLTAERPPLAPHYPNPD